MKQIEAFNSEWAGAEARILKIQDHPSFNAGDLVAYQVVKSLFSDQVIIYNCILKNKRKSPNPYHLGSFNHALSIANYDCIERDYQLSNSGLWWQTQPPVGSPAYPQWIPWVWKNDEEERMFSAWHLMFFEKKKGLGSVQTIKIDALIMEVAEECQQLTLF